MRHRCRPHHHVHGPDPIQSDHRRIGLFIVPRTWKLLSQVVHILMEDVPTEIDLLEPESALLEIPAGAGIRSNPAGVN